MYIILYALPNLQVINIIRIMTRRILIIIYNIILIETDAWFSAQR